MEEIDDEAGVGTAQAPDADGRLVLGDGPTEDFDEAEEAARRARIEHEALVAVFDDVREQSSDGRLVTPSRWEEIGLVPEHLTLEDLEMLVYDCVQEACAWRDGQEAESCDGERAVRTASVAVGVPRFKRPAGADAVQPAFERALDACEVEPVEKREHHDAPGEQPVEEPASSDELDGARDDGEGGFEPFELTVDGVRGMVQLVEGEPTFVPYPPGEAPQEEIDCKRIKLLQGHAVYYLYASDRMTDAFANWAFMANENDDAATLATCAREESRVYPRPMPASSLKNEPFCFDDGRIEAAWQALKESGACPDVREVVASNGDRYFFSTDHLSRAYAESLAEWSSVERYRNV